MLETSGSRVPAISKNPPSAQSQSQSQGAPWSSGSAMSNPNWHSFFDSSEDVSSPTFRPSTGRDRDREDAMGFPLRDDRRPSVQSQNTVSSTGSKSSIGRGFHKRLQNVFGEDFPADGRQHSDTSLNTAAAAATASRHRGNSLNHSSSNHSRPASPTSSRPRTPQPSSEVTPWEFQEPRVSPDIHCTTPH